MPESIRCPYCSSVAVFHIRQNAESSANPCYEAVNLPECYNNVSEEILSPVTDLYRCGECSRFFDGAEKPLGIPSVAYIPADRLRERISNIQETVKFQTAGYKQLCISAQGRIAKASFKDMATRAPAMFEEIQQQFANLQILDAQVDALEHILAHDVVTCPAQENAIQYEQ